MPSRATGEDTSSSSESDAQSPPNPRKRTSSFAEIEVDLKAPEPPSKRARRALKKGKSLPAKPASDDEEDLNPQDEDGAKKKERSEHGVWIGNLPFSVTAKSLREWLIANAGGVITEEAITRIKLPMTERMGRDDKKEQVNKGYAYVDFDDVGPKIAAIALSESSVEGRRLLIKDSKSYEGRPQKAKVEPAPVQKTSEVAPKTGRKIFVGNLGFDVTEDELWAHFEKCGEIEWVKVAQFEDSGKCKGYGWVRFKTPEAAASAVQGFARIPKEVETEEDFARAAEDGAAEATETKAEDGEEAPKKKKVAMRKWWVNRLRKRELKIELAEDDQFRYNKRFGKGAKKRNGRNDREAARTENKENQPAKEKVVEQPKPARELKGHEDLSQARRMGVVAKPTGTKVTFD